MPLYYQNWSFKHKTEFLKEGKLHQLCTASIHHRGLTAVSASISLSAVVRLPLCSLNEQVLEAATDSSRLLSESEGPA